MLKMRIGIVGLGRMGRVIAQRLHETGHSLVIWNRTTEKAKPILELGAVLAESPRDLATKADVIFSILTDATAIESVFGGEEGLLSGGLGGKAVVEMSTVQPETQIAWAGKVRANGGAYVECAVSGTVGPARQGRLIGLLGAAEADFARIRPVLEQLCRRIEHVGPVGSGASLKLAVNLPLLVYYQALGEAYSLCRHLGRDPEWLIELLADTSGGPNILKVRGPVIAAALKGIDPQPVSFDVDGLRKDLRTMVAEAKLRGYRLPITEQALAVYDEASGNGWGDRDGNALPRYWSEQGGSRG
jgi:3-hydroxyisobutyrate dehydrogenase